MNTIRLTKNIEIHPSLNRISVQKAGIKNLVNIEDQLMKILMLLIENRGQLVGKNEFIDKVWEGNSLVGEQALNKNIFKLRQLLKANQIEEEIEIQTIPKKGYQLIITEKKTVPFLKPGVLIASAVTILILLIIGVSGVNKNTPNNSAELLEYDPDNNETVILLKADGTRDIITLDTTKHQVVIPKDH